MVWITGVDGVGGSSAADEEGVECRMATCGVPYPPRPLHLGTHFIGRMGTYMGTHRLLRNDQRAQDAHAGRPSPLCGQSVTGPWSNMTQK